MSPGTPAAYRRLSAWQAIGCSQIHNDLPFPSWGPALISNTYSHHQQISHEAVPYTMLHMLWWKPPSFVLPRLGPTSCSRCLVHARWSGISKTPSLRLLVCLERCPFRRSRWHASKMPVPFQCLTLRHHHLFGRDELLMLVPSLHILFNT